MTGTQVSTPGAPGPQDVKQPGTAVAVQAPAPAPVPMFQQPQDFALSVWTSLPDDRKTDLLMALQADALPLREMLGDDEPLEVQHIVAHRIELVDEKTGEVDEADRIILITPNGDMYACVSKGVRKSVQLLMMAYGMPPWEPPVRVRMNETQTRKGRRLYQLLPADVKVPGKKGR